MARLTLIAGQPSMPVDVAGATSLFYSDIGISGPSLNLAGRSALTLHDVFTDETILFSYPMPTMEVQVTGTPIGGMTGNGGVGAAFDGNLSKSYTACAKSASQVSGYALTNSVGLSLSSPTAITRFYAVTPNDTGFLGDGTSTFWQFLGSNTNDVTTANVLAAGRLPPSASTSVIPFSARFPNGATYSFYWLSLFGNGINNTFCSQLQMFAQLPISSRGITTSSGVQVNASSMVASASSGMIAVAALGARFLGTIMMSESAGQMRFTQSYGTNRMVPIWNADNRRRITVVAGETIPPTSSSHFSYPVVAQPSYAMAPAHGNAQIKLTIINGMAEAGADIVYQQTVFQDGSTAATAYWNGIGINSTSTPFGLWQSVNFDSTGTKSGEGAISQYALPPFYGAVTVSALEGARGNVSAFYGEGNMRLSVTLEY